ncbi:hypothetical protein DFH08DRAFT_953665 [Mycena albidolilacea]|uniref:Uncharacterized protein n=1 Tax=Mycena albidolilacea TaxID=1033008 RepID=A0AAD7AHD9_9AGAR|nr:hypothetical protein DFH08DRAFT_953665 [Mycena albidolilacea]
MNVDPTTASLGWKESLERHNYAHHRLSTAQDLSDAFKHLVALQKSLRCKEPIIMEIVNLITRQTEKQSEIAIAIPELENIKAGLTCALHPGKNRWCYVMPPDSTHLREPVALGIEHAGLWARKIHDGEASDDCVNPPNVFKFDKMANEVALERSALHAVVDRLSSPQFTFTLAMESDSSGDSSDNDDDALTIVDVL